MDKIAIIVAAGSGSRMGTGLPKQFLPIAGKPIVLYTLESFIKAYNDLHIILVLPLEQIQYGQKLIDQTPYKEKVKIIAGGDSRFASVAKGIDCINSEAIVFVHDGVRCLIKPELIQQCYQEALLSGSAIPACPATDSMRIVEKSGQQTRSRSIDREKIRLIQTPQTFKATLLKKAFNQPFKDSFTDEASVLESIGESITLINGDMENIKITRPIDLIIAEAIIARRKTGHDRTPITSSIN